MHSELGSRAVFGGVTAVVLTLIGGILIAYVDVIAAPTSVDVGSSRQTAHTIAIVAAVLTAVCVAISYSIACLLHIVVSKSPAPFLLGTAIPFLYFLFARFDALGHIVAWIPIGFSSTDGGISDVLFFSFAASLATALIAAAVFFVVELLIRLCQRK